MISASRAIYRGTPANADTQLDSIQAIHPGFFVKFGMFLGISLAVDRYAGGDPKNHKQRI